MKKGELERQIRATLARDPQSRNSDIRLMQVVWYSYHKHLLHPTNGEYLVNVQDLYKLPREDHIARLRRKIQNDLHEYVPTDLNVALKRGFTNVEEWRGYLGYTTGDTL